MSRLRVGRFSFPIGGNIMKNYFIVFAIVILLTPIFTAFGANYQGKLTDEFGVGVNDTVDVILCIYDSSSGGTMLSSNTITDVPIVKGLFDVQFDPDLTREELAGAMFLDVTVGGITLSPRIKITASMLTMKAIYADSAAYADSSSFAEFTRNVDWDTLSAYPDTSDMDDYVKTSGDTVRGDIVHADGARSIWVSPSGTDTSWIGNVGDTFHVCSNMPVDICMNNSLIISPERDIHVTHNFNVNDSLFVGKGIKLGGIYQENWPEPDWDTLSSYVTTSYADSIGVFGEFDAGNFGWLGGTVNGGADSVGMYAVGTDYAGYFEGRTRVDGMLEVSVGIDPPFIAFIPQAVRPETEPAHPHRLWVDDTSPGTLFFYDGYTNIPLSGPIPLDTMVAHWDSMRGIPAAWADGIDDIGLAKLRRDGSPWITDSVTFIGGANIVLTQSSNMITIASSGDDWGSQVVQHDTTLIGDGNATLLGTFIGNSIESDEITNYTIQTIDIDDRQITPEKLAIATNNQVLTTDVSGNPQWEPKSIFLSTYLEDSWIYVGSSTYDATAVQMVGDISIDHLGVTEIQTGAVTDTKIDWGTETEQVSAIDIPLEDTGTYYPYDNVEQALDELGHFIGKDFVQLAPVSAQEDITSNHSIHINKTGGSGDLIRLEVGGLNKFNVNYEGDINALGDVTFYGGINDGSDFGIDGQVLKTDGLGDVFWGDEGTDDDWLNAGTGYMYAAHTTDFVGIGTSTPNTFLHVEGDTPEWEAVGFFKNNAPSVNAYGIMARCDNSSGFGIGGHFIGGALGVGGEVLPTGTGDFIGVEGFVDGGYGDNYGVKGVATGNDGGFAYGVKGIATGLGTNYGVYGTASAGSENWAGYFDGNVGVYGKMSVEGITPADEAIGFFKNNITSSNAYGVEGRCDVSEGIGIGGYFVGGSKGAVGEVSATGIGDITGLHGTATGGTGTNCGVRGEADCLGNYAYGLHGTAMNATNNYGVYAVAGGGTNNWAGYFEGDVHIAGDLDVSGVGGARSYTEMMIGVTPGASGAWSNFDLSGFGMVEGDIVEIIIVNDSTISLIGGAQTPGGADRKVPIATEGSLSLHTKVGMGGFIELYMEDNTKMSAYIIGFWR